MRTRLLALLLIALIPSVCLSAPPLAITIPELPAGVSEFVSDEPIDGGKMVVIDVGRKPSAGDEVAFQVFVEPSSVNVATVANYQVRLATPCLCQDGVITLDATQVNWTQKSFERIKITLPINRHNCGPEPPPPPPPPPPPGDCDRLPADPFNNVGRAACKALTTLSKDAQALKGGVKSALEGCALAIRNPQTSGVIDKAGAFRYIAERLNRATASQAQEWNKWRTAINAHIDSLQVQKADVDELCLAMAAGL